MTSRARPVLTLDAIEGDRLIWSEGPAFGVVTVRATFPVGSAADARSKGIGAVGTAMLERGTKRLDREAFNAALERIGAEFSVRTTRRATTIEVQALDEHIEEALERVGEALAEPRDDTDELASLIEEIDEDVESELEDPGGAVGRALAAALWPASPWGAPTNGTARSRRALRSAAIATHRRRLLASSACFGVAAEDPTRWSPLVLAFRERLRGHLTGVAPLTMPEQPDPIWGRGHAIDFPASAQGALTVVSPGPEPGTRTWTAAVLHSVAFGGGFTSPLMRELRAERALSYELDWALSPERGSSLHYFRIYPEGGRLAESLSAARDCWARHGEGRPTDRVLDTAKAMLLSSHAIGLETVEQRLAAGIGTLLIDVDPSRLWELPDEVRDISADEVEAAAHTYAWGTGCSMLVAALPGGTAAAGWREHPPDLPLDAIALDSLR